MISLNSLRLWPAARTFIWILAACLAAVMGSERVYWYWSGIDAESVGILTIYYAVAGAAALFALATTPGSSTRNVVLSGALFALIVEAVLTPVIYEDGPLPLLFIMFVGYHGLLAWTGFVFAVRRWAIEGRTRTLALASTATGAFWGLWALSSGVLDDDTADMFAADGGSADVLVPWDFAQYAAVVVGVLFVAHLILDIVWPEVGWRPSRPGLVAVGVVGIAMFSLVVLPFVLWAPIKLGVLLAGLWWSRRRLPDAGSDTPTVIDHLAGRLQPTSLLGLLPLPIVAAATYAALWPVRDADMMLGLWSSLIFLQVLAGLAAAVWLMRRRPSKIAARLVRRREKAVP